MKRRAIILSVLSLLLLGIACGGGESTGSDSDVDQGASQDLVQDPAPDATPTEQESMGISLEGLPQAVLDEELTIGDTVVVVTGTRLRESIPTGGSLGDIRPQDPSLIFIEVQLTVTNLSEEAGDLEGGEGGNSIFSLIGGDGQGCSDFGRLSEPIVDAGSTMSTSKTFVIHRDAVDGAKLVVVDLFSDAMGVVLLSE